MPCYRPFTIPGRFVKFPVKSLKLSDPSSTNCSAATWYKGVPAEWLVDLCSIS